MKKLLTILLCFVCINAYAANWEFVDRSKGFYTLVDRESIKNDGDYKIAQIKSIPRRDQILLGDVVFETNIWLSVDCNKKTSSILSAVIYGETKEIFSARSIPAEYQEISYNFAEAALIEHVCNPPQE